MANSFIKRASYHVTSEDDIMMIPDVKTAMTLLKSWGLETKGLKTKEQTLHRLLSYYKAMMGEEAKPVIDKTEETVNETTKKLRSNTEKLVQKFETMIKFYNQLPVIHQKSICESCKNLEKIALSKIHDLKNSQSVLAVGGEVGSGQTSFINFLLKTDILPVSEQGCTRVYCQLRKGETPKADVYKRNAKTLEPTVTTLDLNKPKDLQALQSFIATVDENNTQEKAVIEFPFEFLEDDMCLLDIPDSIDAYMPLETILSELPANVVFLYVLDISSTEQSQIAQVEEFVNRIKNTTKYESNDVMVICNKCDLIPEDQLERVKADFTKRLLKIRPDFKRSQIAFMSISEEQKLEPSGLHTNEFQELCATIPSLFIQNMENVLKQEYRWLSKIQKRALYTLKVSKLNSNKTLQERRELMVKLMARIEKFEKESKVIIARLHDEINKEIATIFGKLFEYLHSTDLKAHMTAWIESECPKPEKKWKNLKCSAENCITEKLRNKLREWEEKEGIKTSIQKQIVNNFGQEFELMEEQMKKIGSMLVCGDCNAVVRLHRSFRQDSPILLRSSPSYTGSADKNSNGKNRLSDNVCSIGGFDKKVKKEIKPLFNKYKKTTISASMAKATEIYLKCLVNNAHIKDVVAKYVKMISKDISKIAKMIPDLIEMDKGLLASLESEVMETKQTMHSIPENLRRCLVLQGELDLFFLNEIMSLDYQLKDLDWTETRKLGTGTFAHVYPGTLNAKDGERIDVAIKVFKDPLQANNASEMLLEDETLRELDHQNIITYYGATFLQKGKPLRTYWVMIMASCITNLKTIYLDKQAQIKEEIPGRNPEGSQSYQRGKDSVTHYVIQICAGLHYLHSKKLVHRDLKLENILVTKCKEIKLTDVGLTKPEEDISGTMVGSPIYMAPEVYEQNQIYNRKADIYSLAMALWEMWYGECVSESLDGVGRGRISVEIRKGVRPIFKNEKPYTKPPLDWVELIEKCWNPNPKFRPKAKVVQEFFMGIYEKTEQFV